MNIQEYKKNNRLNEWAEMVKACRSSGKTVLEWCLENGVNEKTYYHRQKRVCDAMPDLRKAPPLPAACGDTKASFAEITPAIRSRVGDPGVTVRIGNAEVRIPSGVETATVEAVLRVLSVIC